MNETKAGIEPKNFAIRQAAKRCAGASILSKVIIEVTLLCNLKCLHCYVEPYHNEPQTKELTATEWSRIFKQLFEMGIWHITFSGGEPLCRPDIYEIMNHAKEQGFFFGLKTNGTLITKPIADRLKEIGFSRVDVSIYGSRAKTHDYVTGVPGSYDKAIRAIKLLRERKIGVNIKTSIMKFNIDEKQEMEKISRELDAYYDPDPLVFDKIGQPGSADNIRPEDEQLRTFFKEAKWTTNTVDFEEADLGNRLICNAGRKTCNISPQGEVFPCALWRVPLGDLKQQNFRDIWYGEAASNIRAIKAKDMQHCASCELLAYCSRCMGMASMENGDILGPSSENCRLARILKGVIDDRRKETVRQPRYRVGKS